MTTQAEVDTAWQAAREAEPKDPFDFDWREHDELSEYAAQLEITMRLERARSYLKRMYGCYDIQLFDQVDGDLKAVGDLVDNMCR